MQHTATLKHLRIAPRKVRTVANLIKGLSVNEAEAQLLMQSRRASGPILKLLRSAVAGAKENDLNAEKLTVQNVRVDQGPMLRRYRMRARGAASLIQKKSCHVKLILIEDPTLDSARFTIVKPEKEKESPKEEKARHKERTTWDEKASSQAMRKKGFLRKIFNRKSI